MLQVTKLDASLFRRFFERAGCNISNTACVDYDVMPDLTALQSLRHNLYQEICKVDAAVAPLGYSVDPRAFRLDGRVLGVASVLLERGLSLEERAAGRPIGDSGGHGWCGGYHCDASAAAAVLGRRVVLHTAPPLPTAPAAEPQTCAVDPPAGGGLGEAVHVWVPTPGWAPGLPPLLLRRLPAPPSPFPPIAELIRLALPHADPPAVAVTWEGPPAPIGGLECDGDAELARRLQEEEERCRPGGGGGGEDATEVVLETWLSPDVMAEVCDGVFFAQATPPEVAAMRARGATFIPHPPPVGAPEGARETYVVMGSQSAVAAAVAALARLVLLPPHLPASAGAAGVAPPVEAAAAPLVPPVAAAAAPFGAAAAARSPGDASSGEACSATPFDAVLHRCAPLSGQAVLVVSGVHARAAERPALAAGRRFWLPGIAAAAMRELRGWLTARRHPLFLDGRLPAEFAAMHLVDCVEDTRLGNAGEDPRRLHNPLVRAAEDGGWNVTLTYTKPRGGEIATRGTDTSLTNKIRANARAGALVVLVAGESALCGAVEGVEDRVVLATLPGGGGLDDALRGALTNQFAIPPTSAVWMVA